MSIRRLSFFLLVAVSFLLATGMPTTSSSNGDPTQSYGLIVGRNVNMVSGTQAPHGDPYLQRQNEPSVAVSTRNPMHLLAGANDYRTIDVPYQDVLPGMEENLAQIRDAWVGVFKSFNGGESWISTLLPGYPQDTSPEGTSSPLYGYDFACDPTVRAGANGLFYYSGIAADRAERGAGVVFVARYIDNNNSEFLDTIEYVDTNIPDQGNSGQFIDMPYIAVDVPRDSGTVTIKGQEIPVSNVYIAYSLFPGHSKKNVRSKILFARSTDCGTTWSKPIKLSESQHILQRPTIAIDPSDPTGNTIYVAFRRFAKANKKGKINQPHAIIILKSTDRGRKFTKAIEVTSFYPFDQGSSNFSFRTNAYPSLTVDGNGIVYLAWAQRMNGPEGFARLVIAASEDGLDWPTGQMKYVELDHAEEEVKGHQFMPSLTYAGGKLMLAWYDQRHDIAQDYIGDQAFTPYIEDSLCRHTIDVRVAYGTLGLYPSFSPSRQVSRYLYTLYVDEYGNPIEDGEGNWIIDQAEFNPINFPLFQQGTTPFSGDWMDAAPSPWILPSSNGQWSFNTSPLQPTTSLMVWTDNRDVNPPGGFWWGNWQNYPEWPLYNAPNSDETPPREPCSNDLNTGMRNQNIYTANISDGLIVGSPQNTKQLGVPFIQRTFVVYANNTTAEERYFQFRINELGSATASFEQELYSNDHKLNVTIAPLSSASVTVFVDPYTGENSTAIRIDVVEMDVSGPSPVPVPGGLYGYVLLNPDPTNPGVIDYSDPNNPEYLGDEYHNPRVWGPRVWGYDLGNASELNPRVQGPRVQGFSPINTGFINPRVQGEDPLNPRVQGPRVWGPRVQGPRVQGINILNQGIINPRVQGPRVQGTALTDVTYPIVNDGNTTSAYSINVRSLFAKDFDEGKLIAQLLIYKVHTSPVSDGCELKQVHYDKLVANIYNPRVQGPRVQGSAPTSRATSQSVGDWQIPEPTIYLEPNQIGYVTVRVWDDDTTDSIVFSPNNVTIDMPAQAPDTGETEPKIGYPPGHGPGEWPDPAPKIWRSPESMSFTAQEGGANPAPQTFQVMNIEEVTTLEYAVTKDVPWLTVSPSGGPLSYNESYPHTVSVNITSLSAGTYTGNIAIYNPTYEASNNPQFVRVKLYVISSTTTASQVKLSGPTWVQAGEISKAYTLVSLDSDGNPAKVSGSIVFNLNSTSLEAKFYSNSGEPSETTHVEIISGSSSPMFYYKDTQVGDHEITAAYASGPDDLDSASHPISVIIGAAEYLKVTGNSTVNAGESKELTIAAYDKYDNVAIGYSGPKFLTFSGPGDAPDGTVPTVEGADIGTTIIVNFTEGVSDTGAATLIAYNAETALINVSDGLIDSLADPSYGFGLTVDPAGFDPNESSVSNVYPFPAVAGDTVTIEITNYDEFQNLRTVGGDSVSISIIAGSANPQVLSNIIFDNGIYSATYMPTVSGIDDIVGEINSYPTKRDADGTSDGTYNLTINPGDANYLTVTGNSTVTAGGSKELTITAFDQYHNVAIGYTGTKGLIFSGPHDAPDGTPPTVAGIEIGDTTTINFNDGVSVTGTATLVVYRAETISIEVDDGTINSFANEAYDFDLTVEPAALHHYKTTREDAGPDLVPADGTTPISIKIWPLDEYGNDRAGSANVSLSFVSLSGPSTSSTLGGTTTGIDTSTGPAQVDDITYTVAQQIRIHADDSSISTPDQEAVVVQYVETLDTIDHYEISLGTTNPAAGQSFTTTVTAQDEANNVITSIDALLNGLTYTISGAGTPPSGDHPVFANSIPFSSGQASFTTTLYNAEILATGTFIVSDDQAIPKTNTTSPELIVNPAPASGGESSISSVSPDPATAGTSVTITVTAYDQYQNALILGEDTVVIEVTESNPATPTVNYIGNGTYTASYTPTVSGPDEITGTINGADIGQDAEGTSDGIYNLTVNPGEASQVALTGPSSVEAGIVSEAFTLESQDSFGNPSNVTENTIFNLTSTSGGTVRFYFNPPTIIPPQVAILADNSSITFYYSDTEAANQTVTATRISGIPFDPAAHQLQVNAGPPFQLAFKNQPTDTHANESISPAVTVEVQDEFSNLVTSADDLVTITLNDIPGAGATLSGGDPNQAIDGVATFDSLSVSGCGEGYTLNASSGTLNPDTSAAFNIFAKIIGTVQWNGASVVDDIPETSDAHIYGRKHYQEPSEESVPSENITYDIETGVYTVTNILPANYKFYATVDTRGVDFKKYPDNYHGEGDPFLVIAGDAVVNYNHNTQKIMRMTAPAGAYNDSYIDESPINHSNPYPPDKDFTDHTYQPEITFVWEPVAEGQDITYNFSLREYDYSDPQHNVLVNHGTGISTNSLPLGPLPPSEGEKFYALRIMGHNDSNWIGKVMVNWTYGLSEYYIFRITPGEASYLKVTGNSTVMAGDSKELTVTAYDAYDNVATGYTGPKDLIFSGPGIARLGTEPTISVGAGTATPIGTVTPINFTNGVSDPAVTLIAYEAETISVDVEEVGGINSFAFDTYDYDLTVTPAPLNYIKIQSVGGGYQEEIGDHEMAAGETLNCCAVGYDAYGNYREDVYVTWSTTGDLDPINPSSSQCRIFMPTSAPTSGTIVAHHAPATDDATGTITVNVGPLDHFDFSPIGNKRADLPFSVTITAKDVGGNTVTSHPGPNGLSLTQPGNITPTNTGTFTNGVWTGDVTIHETHTGVQIQTSGDSKSGTSNSFDVLPPVLLISTVPPLPSGAQGQAYGPVTLEASGGTPPYEWSCNTMPQGLNLSSAGVIDGTPTVTGSFTLEVYCEDGTQTAHKQLSVYLAPQLVITTATLFDAFRGGGYSLNLQAAGGTEPWSWSLVQGQLPDGLQFFSSGEISGVVTQQAETEIFTVQVTDDGTPIQTATKQMTINVYDTLNVETSSLPDGVVAITYNQTLSASGGNGDYSWSLVEGQGLLPDNLSLGSNGMINGEPTTMGTFNFKVQVTDTSYYPQTAQQPLSITIAPHTVSTPNTPNGPTWGISDISYTYNTGGATCSIGGHNVEYRFDWGDGSYSSWSSSASASHAYTNVGSYSVKAQARCSEANSIESSLSSGFTVDIWPTISGTVTDGGGNPIAGVQVISINGAWGDDTDANGNYRVEVPYDQYVTGLEALKIGYTFSPIYQMIDKAVTDNIVGKDFTGTLNTYTLTVVRDGTGSGEVNSSLPGISCGDDCTEVYDYNTVVTLTALPESGSEFSGWSGECSGTGTCQVTMTKNTTVTATFNILHTISAPNAPTGTTSGIPNTSYWYSLSNFSICSHGHIVTHQFDWGDSSQSGWISGSNETHSWSSPGIYQVKVRGKCTEGLVSDWSPPLSVTINPRISGYVMYQPPIGPPQPVQGLTIYFSGGVGPALTNSGGYYKKTVPYNWSGTVVPSDLYNYSTTYRTYTNVTADTTSQNYGATTQYIHFTTQPTNASAGQLISVKVRVHDGSQNPMPGIMVTLNIGANPGGITFTPKSSTTNDQGIATLSFSIGTSNVGYTVVATAGGNSVSSVPFDIY